MKMICPIGEDCPNYNSITDVATNHCVEHEETDVCSCGCPSIPNSRCVAVPVVEFRKVWIGSAALLGWDNVGEFWSTITTTHEGVY